MSLPYLPLRINIDIDLSCRPTEIKRRRRGSRRRKEKPETRNPKPETRNPKPETRQYLGTSLYQYSSTYRSTTGLTTVGKGFDLPAQSQVESFERSAAHCAAASASSTSLPMSLLFFFLLCLAALGRGVAGPHKMVSLFSMPYEAEYDQYAACLAAMEPLKAELLQRVRKSSPAKVWYWTAMRRGSVCDPAFDPKGQNAERRRACADYVLKSSAAIEAMGLDVKRFNALSRQIANDRALRQKVYQQAYLYRVGAELDGEKVPLVEPLSTRHNLKRNSRAEVQIAEAQRVGKMRISEDRARRFALALKRIEDMRRYRLQTLAKEVSPCCAALAEAKLLNLFSPLSGWREVGLQPAGGHLRQRVGAGGVQESPQGVRGLPRGRGEDRAQLRLQDVRVQRAHREGKLESLLPRSSREAPEEGRGQQIELSGGAAPATSWCAVVALEHSVPDATSVKRATRGVPRQVDSRERELSDLASSQPRSQACPPVEREPDPPLVPFAGAAREVLLPRAAQDYCASSLITSTEAKNASHAAKYSVGINLVPRSELRSRERRRPSEGSRRGFSSQFPPRPKHQALGQAAKAVPGPSTRPAIGRSRRQRRAQDSSVEGGRVRPPPRVGDINKALGAALHAQIFLRASGPTHLDHGGMAKLTCLRFLRLSTNRSRLSSLAACKRPFTCADLRRNARESRAAPSLRSWSIPCLATCGCADPHCPPLPPPSPCP
eukprot:scaffold434_cov186-Pinguiococcus_pyrenoidosus.AAC.70